MIYLIGPHSEHSAIVSVPLNQRGMDHVRIPELPELPPDIVRTLEDLEIAPLTPHVFSIWIRPEIRQACDIIEDQLKHAYAAVLLPGLEKWHCHLAGVATAAGIRCVRYLDFGTMTEPWLASRMAMTTIAVEVADIIQGHIGPVGDTQDES